MHIENVIMIINVRNKCKLVEYRLSKKLEDMSLEELWQLFPIFLVKHNKEWADWYDEEATAILSLIPAKYIVRISHIGSTAVQNIWAKNIVDILFEVRLAEELEIVKNILVENNWLCMSQSTRRISLNKGYTEQGFAEKVFHLHIRVENHNVAKEYEHLKLNLWKKFEHDRDGYTDAKCKFIKRYTKIAKEKFIGRY